MPAREKGRASEGAPRELVDFIALVLLAIKEEIEDLRHSQSRQAQAFSARLMEIGKAIPGSPAMAEIVGLMQGDDLRNQRQQHVVNALRYVEDLIREHLGRDWAPALTERAAGWGEGLLASQTLEQVRAHFHHHLLGGDPAAKPAARRADGRVETEPADEPTVTASEVELF